MKRSTSLSDVISSFEKKDEIYRISLSSSTSTSTSATTKTKTTTTKLDMSYLSDINTDSEYSSSLSSSRTSSRPSSRPTSPSLLQVPHFNVLNIEDGVCRQLPCKTWISTGTCPFGRRCQFNHDPRCSTCYAFILKTRRKSTEDNITDSLFWPPLPRYILSNYDHKNEPITAQHYLIPHHQNAPYLVKVGGVSCLIDKNQAEALYSMYNYFIDFLNSDAVNAYEKLYSLSSDNYQQYNQDFYYNNEYSNDVNFNIQPDYTYSQDYSHDDTNNNDDSNCNQYKENFEDDFVHYYNEHTGKRRLNVFIKLSEGKSI